jgi:catechol 2,3-dioxygenase-like lactoylglutathione lyase family enzyme
MAQVESGIRRVAAVTLATRDMRGSVGFYRGLGFRLHYGGEEAGFTSFALGEGHLNLIAVPGERHVTWWGRVILYVEDVDALHAHARALGLEPEAAPRDAEWGERYFHLRDPDGHELSFAQPLGTA